VTETLWGDIRFAARSLRHAKLFSVTAVLTLALGIGAATTVFSLVNSILLRPLPFADADRLLVLAQRTAQGVASGVSYPNFIDWQRGANPSTFAGMAFVRGRGMTYPSADGPRNALVGMASPGYFGVLGERPALGRIFAAGEEQSGGRVAVLTHQFWVDQFGADPAAIGKSLALSDGSFTIIGVLPRGVVYPSWAEVYIPLSAVASTERALTARGLLADSRTIARLTPGATVARATLELSAIAKRLAVAYPDDNREWTSAQVGLVRDEVLAGAGSPLTVLSAAVALVLLIGWVNVTNLALVRAAARVRELAIRTSLGASRGRIVRQLLTEYLLVAVIAGGLGTLFSIWAIAVVKQVAAGILPRVDTIALNGSALAFTAGLVLVSAIAVGLLPLLRIARGDLNQSLRQGTAGAGSSRGQQRVRAGLVVGEIGFALALVITAGLLIKSFWRLNAVDPGFNTHHLVAIDFSPPGARYAEPAQAAAFYARMLDAARGVPGAERAALTNHLPLNGASLSSHVEIPGRPIDPRQNPSVLFRTISPEYLATMGIPVRRGRGFVAADLTSGSAVLVNEAFVKQFWPNEDPVGRTLTLHKSAQGRPDFGDPMPGQVVGVIGDVRHFGLTSQPVPEVYIPYSRNPWGHMVVVVRATHDAAALIPALRRAFVGVEPAITLTGGALGGFQVVDDIRSGGLSSQRLNMGLLGSFAASALLLAAIGIYGLMAYAVAQRQRELGIRLALGAQRGDVVRLVLGTGMRIIALGLAIGVAGALGLTRLASGLLFGVAPTDLLTFIVTTGLLAAVAFVACYVPARRASRVDPALALRSE
jgi:putative ABC transport system permease protein